MKSFVVENSIDSVFVNGEYTVYGKDRLEKLRVMLENLDVALCVYDDVLLFPPGFILKADGLPYTVFTPFYNKAKQFPVEKVRTVKPVGLQKPLKQYRFSASKLAEYWQISPLQSPIRNQRIDVLRHLVDCQDDMLDADQ